MEQYWADKALDESIRKLNEGIKASTDEYRAHLKTLLKHEIQNNFNPLTVHSRV